MSRERAWLEFSFPKFMVAVERWMGLMSRKLGEVQSPKRAVMGTWAVVQGRGDKGLNRRIVQGWRGRCRLEDPSGVDLSRTMPT